MAERKSWIDADSNEVLIDDYAKQLGGFLDAFADGQVDAAELQGQEERVVSLMQEVEPLLDDASHEKVTKLLCELSAFNIMQFAHELGQARPKTAFRG